MAAPTTARVRPCPICGGQCKRFPDLPSDRTNPFLGATAADLEPAPEAPKQKRPKGKRRPAEDRARHLQEDR
jgi:hypothetical protein